MNKAAEVRDARDEAVRFVAYCDRYLDRNPVAEHVYNSKEMGAVKAASLLLTRRLAEVRK